VSRNGLDKDYGAVIETPRIALSIGVSTCPQASLSHVIQHIHRFNRATREGERFGSAEQFGQALIQRLQQGGSKC